MSDDIHIRIVGRAGRITLNRPDALNALSYEMALRIEAALDAWANDDAVSLVVIDAVGDRAFCAGGDLADMYRTAVARDFAYGRKFWADEYRLNAKIFNFPKVYVAFMQGFTMGGGVGIACHGSHRVVCENSQIAMPECGIGLIPDVGGTLLLSRAPGRLGEYLGTTGTRMGPGDAILAEFADIYIPRADWPTVIGALEETGDYRVIDAAAQTPPEAPLAALQPDINAHFGGETIWDIQRSLQHDGSAFSQAALTALARQSPLSIACTIELIHRIRGAEAIEPALGNEYRFVWRALEQGDFIEGIRAAIIDKDRQPKWRHASLDDAKAYEMSAMLLPLGANALKL